MQMTDSTSRSSLQQDSVSTAPVLTAAEYIAAVCLHIGVVHSFPSNVHDTSLSELRLMDISTTDVGLVCIQ